MKPRVWFITGTSTGLGRALVQSLLQNGQRVAATSRSLASLTRSLGPAHENFLPLEVDLVHENNVSRALAKTAVVFGGIDVLINNAGFGHFGALEEISDQEARRNFDVNVFGMLNVIRNALPYMRKARSGHIFNISSIGGFAGGHPATGIYCATKFAIAGLSETLQVEVAPFGIKVTVVYPGYFRTHFLDARSMSIAARTLDAYEQVAANISHHQRVVHQHQSGDPMKAALALQQVVAMECPPHHLFLGPDAHEIAAQKLTAMQKELAQWKHITEATDLDLSY